MFLSSSKQTADTLVLLSQGTMFVACTVGTMYVERALGVQWRMPSGVFILLFILGCSFLISAQARRPAEFKHIIKRRTRN